MPMRLSQPIYEKLPFLYFIISTCLLINGESIALMLSALLFYGAACVTLVTRSQHRRLDKPSTLKEYALPNVVYEYMPYFFGAIAILSVVNGANPYIQFIAFIVGLFSLRIILFRHNNRCKAKGIF